MTTLRQLYDLQELDLEMAQCQERISSIDPRIGNRSELEALAAQQEAQKEIISGLNRRQRSESLDAESTRTKVNELESRLYGGTITNVREMEGFQQEASYLREQLQGLDERLLETMVALDEAQKRLKTLKEASRQMDERWGAEQGELRDELESLRAKVVELEGRRAGLASQVSGQDMRLYEQLRVSKRGQAVAKVERGMCRGCSMALPTHQLQRARTGKEPVLCSSCGRILFVS